MNIAENYIKIIIPITRGIKESTDETLWVKKIDDSLVQIENIPVYTNNVSYKDIVEYKNTPNEFFVDFVKVAHESGNKTLQLFYKNSFFKNRKNIFLKEIFPGLKKLGCEDYEGDMSGSIKFIAINIPSQANLDLVISFLNTYKNQGFNFQLL